MKENLSGKTFGNIKVISDDGEEKVYCQCLLCGNKKMMDRHNIKRRKDGGCGCKRKESGRKNAYALNKKRDITGKTFDGVKVIEWTGKKSGTQKIFLCQCLRCGKLFETVGASVTRGDTKSCGCLKNKISTDQITRDCIDGTKISAIKPRIKANNTSGTTGVSRNQKHGYWTAYITFQGKRYHLYCGPDKDIAIAKRKEAEKHVHGDFIKWLRVNNPELFKKYFQLQSPGE